MYTIGQVSEMFSLPISTLRYYDKEGLFPQMERSSGIRHFSERELEALRVIECLKRSGLEIKEIKQFMQWCAEGSGTYPQRHALFEHQLETVKAEMNRLEKTLDMLRFKCWYYERAMADGGEDALHRHLLDMGITPGVTVLLQKTAPMGDPVEIRLRGYALTLRLDDAQKITLR